MGVFAIHRADFKISILETSRELFENDLLKKIRTGPCGPGATFFIGRSL